VPATALKELEEQLAELSHADDAIRVIETFSAELATTGRRIAVFNAERALVRRPILPEEARALGFDQPDDAFVLLQGDVIGTESAFCLGERVTGRPKYTVLSSSCDLVPERRSAQRCSVSRRFASPNQTRVKS
jgi:hypothetical protein